MLQWLKKITHRNPNAKWGELVQPSAHISNDSELGAYTYVGFHSFITKAKIGRYCSIANNVAIGHGEHLPQRISTSSLFYEDAYSVLTTGECIIGNDVWIGVNATIRRGITIGDGAIIGANAFVNKNVEPYTIVGGVPARLIRPRFTPEQAARIQASRWWMFPPEEARRIIAGLENDPLFAAGLP